MWRAAGQATGAATVATRMGLLRSQSKKLLEALTGGQGSPHPGRSRTSSPKKRSPKTASPKTLSPRMGSPKMGSQTGSPNASSPVRKSDHPLVRPHHHLQARKDETGRQSAHHWACDRDSSQDVATVQDITSLGPDDAVLRPARAPSLLRRASSQLRSLFG